MIIRFKVSTIWPTMNRECIVIVKETDVGFSMELSVPRTPKNALEQIYVRSFCPCVDPKIAQNLLYPLC